MTKKPILIFLLLTLTLSLSGCAAEETDDARLTVVCTTYPIYLFASSVAQGVDGVSVERLDTGSASCLHDYTLSMEDMKKLERADVIALNGAGLEEFLEDALAASDAVIIDCSEGVDLLESPSHDHDADEDHDHGHWDPHYWMDPGGAVTMVGNIRRALEELDPEHAEAYMGGALTACALLGAWDSLARDLLRESPAAVPGLITFHDGFQYFARAYDLPLLASIEEEAGSEASAREIVEITELVRKYNLPVIFSEVNGSDATANAVARETGCAVARLSMVMDGPDGDLGRYEEALLGNITAVVNGFAGREVIQTG